MNNLVLSFEHITVIGHSGPIFDDLDFTINKGENWALIGQSGSGKTALLETIAGNLNISKGEVEHPFFDEFIKENRIADPLFNWHKLIARVSAKHQFRNLSNTSDFYYQQRFNSMDSEDAETVETFLLSVKKYRVNGPWDYDKVVNSLKLQSLLDKQLIKLSNGETKRLLLASALITNPVLLLLDNPLAGLDVNTRKEFDQLVTEISASGITIIMVTSPKEIPDAITHVAVLDKGKLLKHLAKADFNPDEFNLLTNKSIDTSELRQLLSVYPQQRFDNLVEMQDVTIRYGDKTILDKVSWKIDQGERWALLGHNGAGKSTLLSLINGDNPQAYANDIILFDRKRGSGESIWDIKKKIGFLSPELFQYFPTDTSCLQAIESGFYDTIGLFRKSIPANSEIAKRWMRLLEIGDSAHKLLKNVSISTQRLCLIVRALVKNPPLLIFDEPCQGLDQHQQEHFRDLIDAICENSNVTLIYVSHYQHEIPASVNHTLKLDKGMVIENS